MFSNLSDSGLATFRDSCCSVIFNSLNTTGFGAVTARMNSPQQLVESLERGCNQLVFRVDLQAGSVRGMSLGVLQQFVQGLACWQSMSVMMRQPFLK